MKEVCKKIYVKFKKYMLLGTINTTFGKVAVTIDEIGNTIFFKNEKYKYVPLNEEEMNYISKFLYLNNKYECYITRTVNREESYDGEIYTHNLKDIIKQCSSNIITYGKLNSKNLLANLDTFHICVADASKRGNIRQNEKYDAKRNTLFIFGDINKYSNKQIKHFVTHGLVHMSARYEDSDGKVKVGLKDISDSFTDFSSIDEGVTELITNEIEPPNTNEYNVLQQVQASRLSQIIGKDDLLQWYSNADYEGLKEKMLDIIPDKTHFDVYKTSMDLSFSLQKNMLAEPDNITINDDFLAVSEYAISNYFEQSMINEINTSDMPMEEIEDRLKIFDYTKITSDMLEVMGYNISQFIQIDKSGEIRGLQNKVLYASRIKRRNNHISDILSTSKERAEKIMQNEEGTQSRLKDELFSKVNENIVFGDSVDFEEEDIQKEKRDIAR